MSAGPAKQDAPNPTTQTNQALIDALREALEPFVKHWHPWMGDTEYHPDSDEMSTFARVTFGDLRRARTALARTKDAE